MMTYTPTDTQASPYILIAEAFCCYQAWPGNVKYARMKIELPSEKGYASAAYN